MENTPSKAANHRPFLEGGGCGRKREECTNICVITIWSPGNATKAKLCFQAHSNVCLCVPGTIPLSKRTGQQFPVQLFAPRVDLKPQGRQKLKSTAEHSDKLDPLSSNRQLGASHESVGQVALGTDPDSIMGWMNTIKEFILLL